MWGFSSGKSKTEKTDRDIRLKEAQERSTRMHAVNRLLAHENEQLRTENKKLESRVKDLCGAIEQFTYRWTTQMKINSLEMPKEVMTGATPDKRKTTDEVNRSSGRTSASDPRHESNSDIPRLYG